MYYSVIKSETPTVTTSSHAVMHTRQNSAMLTKMTQLQNSSKSLHHLLVSPTPLADSICTITIETPQELAPNDLQTRPADWHAPPCILPAYKCSHPGSIPCIWCHNPGSSHSLLQVVLASQPVARQPLPPQEQSRFVGCLCCRCGRVKRAWSQKIANWWREIGD
jgi:hypothetical protein